MIVRTILLGDRYFLLVGGITIPVDEIRIFNFNIAGTGLRVETTDNTITFGDKWAAKVKAYLESL